MADQTGDSTQKVNETSATDLKEILRLLAVLQDRGLARKSLVLLVADSAHWQGKNWLQKKRIVEEVFSLAEQFAKDIKLQ